MGWRETSDMGTGKRRGCVMIDVSYRALRLPRPDEPLDYVGANAIEQNLFSIIRVWPVFESEQKKPFLGSYDYLDVRDGEEGTPADGITVTFMQHLPRLLVLIDGEGLENVSWWGDGWTNENGLPVYYLQDPSEVNANKALKKLWFSSTGHADITISLAGENLAWDPGGLKLCGGGKTTLLFRDKATWGLAKAKYKTWGGAPGTWGEASQLRKGDVV